MKQAYASTFVSGMQSIIEHELKRIITDVAITRVDDGMILYSTAASLEQLGKLGFFNNTFAIVTFVDDVSTEDPIKHLVTTVREDEKTYETLQHVLPQKGSYTIRASVENQPIHLHPIQKQKLEKLLSQMTSLTVDRQNPDIDLWLYVRKEGYGFFGMRYTDDRDSYLEKGELRPELAHLLCLMSEPSETDRFLDPFCGSGSIPRARASIMPYASITATDTDELLINALRQKMKKEKVKIDMEKMDAEHLKFPDHHFNKIVTDPPWGVFGRAVDLQTILQELHRVLEPGGVLVLLLSRSLPLLDTVKKIQHAFEVLEHLDILVSGQKATVYKLRSI